MQMRRFIILSMGLAGVACATTGGLSRAEHQAMAQALVKHIETQVMASARPRLAHHEIFLESADSRFEKLPDDAVAALALTGESAAVAATASSKSSGQSNPDLIRVNILVPTSVSSDDYDVGFSRETCFGDANSSMGGHATLHRDGSGWHVLRFTIDVYMDGKC